MRPARDHVNAEAKQPQPWATHREDHPARHRRARLSQARIVATTVAVLFGLLPVPSSAAPPCTDAGTIHGDQIVGTAYRDVLCARGGQDYINGRGSADVARGGQGADTVVGGEGADRIHGRRGNDQLFGTDGVGNDAINGGPGFDRCYGDAGDEFLDCEHRVEV